MPGQLTKGELRFMRALWKLGRGSVNDVLAAVGKPKPAYTTALTMLRILEQKGFANRELDGRAHVYVPAIAERDAATSAIGEVVKSFFPDRSPELALALIADARPSKAEIERLKALIARYEGEAK